MRASFNEMNTITIGCDCCQLAITGMCKKCAVLSMTTIVAAGHEVAVCEPCRAMVERCMVERQRCRFRAVDGAISRMRGMH